MDPYFQIHDRLPGSTCTQHYECKSKHCSMEEGVCKVKPYKGELLSTCQVHSDCNAGKYCADYKVSIEEDWRFAIVKPNSDLMKEKTKVCSSQRQQGQSCTEDFDCLNSLACANGFCQRYGLIQDYERSDNPKACVSGFNAEIYD